jgi:hypothetical protein
MHRYIALLEDGIDSVHMIEVTMGAEDIADLDVEAFGFLKDEFSVPRRIDDRALPRGLVAHEVDEIVPRAGLELVNEDL